jgi:hypothetical protein
LRKLDDPSRRDWAQADFLPDRASNFGLPEIMSSPGIKNISVSTQPDSLHINSHPVPLRGALAIVTNEGRVAVDADVATDERD